LYNKSIDEVRSSPFITTPETSDSEPLLPNILPATSCSRSWTRSDGSSARTRLSSSEWSDCIRETRLSGLCRTSDSHGDCLGLGPRYSYSITSCLISSLYTSLRFQSYTQVRISKLRIWTTFAELDEITRSVRLCDFDGLSVSITLMTRSLMRTRRINCSICSSHIMM
jgi:hypothetical protein